MAHVLVEAPCMFHVLVQRRWPDIQTVQGGVLLLLVVVVCGGCVLCGVCVCVVWCVVCGARCMLSPCLHSLSRV